MTVQVTVRYTEVYKCLEPLRGLRLRGSLQGPPTSKFPLRTLIEHGLRKIIDVEEYRGSRVVMVHVHEDLYLACHFGVEQPDDFCVALEGENAAERVKRAAHSLSRLTKESYTMMLSAVIHALQGVISAEEEEVEEISDPDQVIEELLTWLPEYIAVVD